LIAAVKSDSGPSSRITTSHNRPTASATSIDNPSDFISSSASRTSFTIRPVAKPKSKLRGRTERGNLSRLAVFMPEPALMTSIITLGSSPDFTPITTASEVATMAVADKKLLASFMVCPAPGFSPMKKTLPITSSACFTVSNSARGPDTITASVPFSAPATPPETGLSICTMFRFASRTWMRTAI
jgi:hypothetical protein